VTVSLARGDVIEHQTASGGGVGAPSARDRRALVDDVLDGKVSTETARTVYGVDVDESWLA
jgi:N-methylhydantoinase B